MHISPIDLIGKYQGKSRWHGYHFKWSICSPCRGRWLCHVQYLQLTATQLAVIVSGRLKLRIQFLRQWQIFNRESILFFKSKNGFLGTWCHNTRCKKKTRWFFERTDSAPYPKKKSGFLEPFMNFEWCKGFFWPFLPEKSHQVPIPRYHSMF